jgi:hypothetical protein
MGEPGGDIDLREESEGDDAVRGMNEGDEEDEEGDDAREGDEGAPIGENEPEFEFELECSSGLLWAADVDDGLLERGLWSRIESLCRLIPSRFFFFSKLRVDEFEPNFINPFISIYLSSPVSPPSPSEGDDLSGAEAGAGLEQVVYCCRVSVSVWPSW